MELVIGRVDVVELADCRELVVIMVGGGRGHGEVVVDFWSERVYVAHECSVLRLANG